MEANFKHYLILNLTVFVWGFTGVIGNEISIAADKIVFFRMGIAFLSLLLIGFFFRKTRKLTPRQTFYVLMVGVVVGLHWFTFFYSIKISKVSVAVVCMSATTLFTAIIEPLLFKRKSLISEFLLAVCIVVGIVLIIGFEPEYIWGIGVGLISAFLAATFNTFNGKFIKSMPTFQITKYEMLGGFLTLALLLLINGELTFDLFTVSALDWTYLLILGLICTTAAFLISVWLMQYLSPFTMSMGINMEPIYAILIVLAIDYYNGKATEQMSYGFYLGSAVIIGAVFLNAYLKKRLRQA